jgi:hypothetical protein
VNDVAIALLFQTLADWNLQNSRTSTKQRLRVLMPTDLRERGDRWLTAANRVGYSFLSRSIGQCHDWDALIAGISQETKYIKGIRLGLDFLQILSAVQRIPYLLPALLRLPRCMATAVLTNLGDTTGIPAAFGAGPCYWRCATGTGRRAALRPALTLGFAPACGPWP